MSVTLKSDLRKWSCSLEVDDQRAEKQGYDHMIILHRTNKSTHPYQHTVCLFSEKVLRMCIKVDAKVMKNEILPEFRNRTWELCFG